MTAGGGKANTMALFDLGKGAHGPAGNGLDLQVRPLAQLPVLELDKYHAVVLCPGREKLMPAIVMQDSTASFSFSRKWSLTLFMTASVCSRVEPVGSMDLDQQDPLVFIREIGCGHAQEQEPQSCHNQRRTRQSNAVSWQAHGRPVSHTSPGTGRRRGQTTGRTGAGTRSRSPPAHAPWAPA